MKTQAYITMPPHSRCNVNGKSYEIVSCRQIKKELALRLLDKDEFSNGIDRKLLKRSGLEDKSDWWYNSVEDLIMVKSLSGRYYIKKLRKVSNINMSNAYQIACDNYSVICEYVARKKREQQ